ncbi:MAG: YggT family protein [Pseudomonadota bacterium]|nr:YggT family protein [Pseudomonadota bacterium]
MSHFINSFAHVLDLLFNFIQLVVIASVVVSWVNADPYNPIVRMINGITEPIYRPIRKYTGRITGSIDLSPFVVILIVVFLQRGLIPLLVELSKDMATTSGVSGGIGGMTGDPTDGQAADQLNRDVY